MSDAPTPLSILPVTHNSLSVASGRTERWKPRTAELQPAPKEAVASLYHAAVRLAVRIFNFHGTSEPTQMLSSTAQHLHAMQADRERVLLGKLDQELAENATSIAQVDSETLRTRGRVALRALLRQNVPMLTLSITSDFSLYFRAHLAAGQGTLHLEIFTGPDADPAEDTLATLYQGVHQRWALGGTFLATMDALRAHLTASSSAIGIIR